MYRQHFGLRCAPLDKDSIELWDDGAITHLRDRFQWLLDSPGVGLLTGIELHGAARPYCERLMELGLLCKETHDHVIRIAPPLMISREDLEWAVARVKETFAA